MAMGSLGYPCSGVRAMVSRFFDGTMLVVAEMQVSGRTPPAGVFKKWET